MEIKDFLVTSIYLIIILMIAYFIRPKVTNKATRKYFFPALLVKFIGAISLGLVYQFYYGGGDTFGFTTYGGSYIWDAFWDNQWAAAKLIFGTNEFHSDTFRYASKMWYFDDSPTYFVVRVTGFLSIFTFDTYSTIAIIFACISFICLWAMYSSLQEIYPLINKQIFFTLFLIPSTVFWGSGILKDTLTLAALAWSMHALLNIFVLKRRNLALVVSLFLALYIIYIIKIYILLCFLPAMMIWIFLIQITNIKSFVLRVLIGPSSVSLAIALSLFGVIWISNSDEKYSIENVLKTAEITAKDNSIWTVRKEGSGYNLGDYDFSPAGIRRKFIPAVWVTLFRPYLWEAKNPMMLLSAFESFAITLLFIYLVAKAGVFNFIKYLFSEPILIFCVIFTISFAFAIGISSGNFGSLVRYKIPILPFFVLSLFILQHYTSIRKAQPPIQKA